MPLGIKTALYYKETPLKYSAVKMKEYMKEPMTKDCKQPFSGVTHAGPILLLWPHKCGTNSL